MPVFRVVGLAFVGSGGWLLGFMRGVWLWRESVVADPSLARGANGCLAVWGRRLLFVFGFFIFDDGDLGQVFDDDLGAAFVLAYGALDLDFLALVLEFGGFLGG
jgi:hypothetical protein